MRPTVGIVGSGSALPDLVVSSTEIDERLGIATGWTERATGIRERRWAPAGTSLTDLTVEAGQAALASAGVRPDQLRAVVVATVTPDPPVPAVAARVQGRIGASHAFAFDLNAACAGFVFALDVARLLVEDALVRPYVLVIGGDVWSRMTDPLDRRTRPLFGDGAGAVVLGPVEHGGILATTLATDGSLGDLAVGGYSPAPPDTTPGPSDHLFKMRGKDISDLMLDELPKMLDDVTRKASLRIDDIDYLICHQANPKLVARCAARAGLAPEQNVDTGVVVGNTVAASVPIGIDVAAADGRLQAGKLVALAAFGAGMSWGTTLVRWT